MTDLNHLPNGYDLPGNRMSKEEWKHYFKCRKKYDVEYSEDEVIELMHRMDEVFDRGDHETFAKLSAMVPYNPDFALDIKRTEGLKALMYANLSDARKTFSDEF